MPRACAASRPRAICAVIGERFARPERSPVEEVAQRLAVEQLGDRVTDAVVVAEVVNRQDVGVRNRGHRTRLALEARDAIGIGGQGFAAAP